MCLTFYSNKVDSTTSIGLVVVEVNHVTILMCHRGINEIYASTAVATFSITNPIHDRTE